MTHYVENIHFTGKLRGEQPGNKKITRVAGYSDLSHYLVGSDSLTDIVKRAIFFISDLVTVKTCRIYLLDRNGNWHHSSGDDGHYYFSRTYEDSSRDTTTLKRLFDSVVSTGSRQENWMHELNRDEYTALHVPHGAKHWLIPLLVENEPVGILFLSQPVDPQNDPFTSDASYVVDLVADQLSTAIHRNQLNERISNLSIETVLALSRTLDARDSHSGSHSKRMAGLSERMGIRYHMTTRDVRELSWAALLHDIGKIGVEDQILYKPGPLTEREWEIMKTHPEIGAQMVGGLSGMEKIACMILGHHERMDGSGYPRGLAGEQIPLGARILAVVDSYSAMTEGRPYRKAKSHDEAIIELKNLSGKQYDANVVSTFIGLFEEEQNGFFD